MRWWWKPWPIAAPFISVSLSRSALPSNSKRSIQAGQRLSKYIRREAKEADLEKKRQHIEMFAPILVDGACRITNSPKSRREKALEGLAKILGRDAALAEQELAVAVEHAEEAMQKMEKVTGILPTSEEAKRVHDAIASGNADGGDNGAAKPAKKAKGEGTKAKGAKKPKAKGDKSQAALFAE